MIRLGMALALLLALNEKPGSLPSFDYDVARAPEIKPHRRSIPHQGVKQGLNQLRLRLTVAAEGDVMDAQASGEEALMKFWPELQLEVRKWKFTPFEMDGKPVSASVEEYIDLVPPERFPKVHVTPPVLRPDSKVTMELERSGCYGSCAAYGVEVSTDGIIFDGRGFVVAQGKHTDRASAAEVRELARKFIAADFYSMDAEYAASVTDMPAFVLSISIDGKTKKVLDYVGIWEGMPAIITELEDDVDKLARTQRWTVGADGLVGALQAEKFNFQTFEAQFMLKQAASRGQTATVMQILKAGVPRRPRPIPKSNQPFMAKAFSKIGFLNAASSHPETLRILINAGVSKHDQNDKDAALAGVACSGNVEVLRELIAYGADPNVDLRGLVREDGSAMSMPGQEGGSILICAAESGKPEMVSEILHYSPNLEARDREGKTAMFAAAEYQGSAKDGERAECVRLLAQAGANVNARDHEGNTPLHETFLTEVEAELLKLGAHVNARNKDGETPIFTTVDNDAIPLFISHGADLTIKNKKGETVMEAAKEKGPLRQEALRKAIETAGHH